MGDSQNRFFEWNYDEGVVIAYERQGECNGCGDCCKATIRFAVAGQFIEDGDLWQILGNGGVDTTGKHIWSEVRVRGERRFFSVEAIQPGTGRCSHLTGDNRCDVQLTKPLFHKAWPMSPRQTVPFERCSYTFRELARWPLASLKGAGDKNDK